MALDTNTVIDRIMGRAAARSLVADQADISTGVEADIDDVSSFSVYIKTEGQVNVEIELSPDGTNWYKPGDADSTPDESPVQFNDAGTEIISMAYDADRIRLTGSNTTAVTVQIKEVV